MTPTGGMRERARAWLGFGASAERVDALANEFAEAFVDAVEHPSPQVLALLSGAGEKRGEKKLAKKPAKRPAKRGAR